MSGSITSSPKQVAGGQAALGGYLFQFVSTLKFVIDAWQTEHGASGGSDDLDLIFRAVRKSGLAAEIGDADAAAVGLDKDDATVILQVKYSGAPSAYPIRPGDLKLICTAMKKHAIALKQQTGRVADRFVLLSNRDLSVQAKALLAKAKQRPRAAPRGWKSSGAWSVLKKTYYQPTPGLGAGLSALQRFGATLGALNDESLQAAPTLVGKIMIEVGYGRSVVIDHKMLAEAIVGSSEALSLEPGRVANVTRDEVGAFLRLCDYADDFPSFPRRQLIGEIESASRNSALIVVLGRGGVGKTVAAAQWLSERLERIDHHGNAFAAMHLADRVTADAMRAVFRRWANTATGPNTWPADTDGVERIMQRCAIAQAALGAHATGTVVNYDLQTYSDGPYYVLALDGIDEGAAINRDELRAMLDWFAAEHDRIAGLPEERPRAVLVVTCRNDYELKEFLTPPVRAPRAVGRLRYSRIRATEFSREELVDVASQLDDSIASRIARTFSTVGLVERTASPVNIAGGASIGSGRASDFVNVTGSAMNISAADPSIASALRHPALWDRFSSLPGDSRNAVLDADAVAINALSHLFIEWAITKCVRRIGPGPREVLGITSHLLGTAKCASEMADTDGPFPPSLWIKGYDAGRPHSRQDALDVELERGGVIDIGNNDTWSWRHGFVGKWLASAAADQELRAWARTQVP